MHARVCGLGDDHRLVAAAARSNRGLARHDEYWFSVYIQSRGTNLRTIRRVTYLMTPTPFK